VNIQEAGWGAWTGLIWLRRGAGGAVVNAEMNLWVP